MKQEVKSYSIATIRHSVNRGEQYGLLENYCEPDELEWSKDWKLVEYFDDLDLAHDAATKMNEKLER